ncbi:hypothetical protein GCM10011297_12590 [Bacterioplanes sanyensis]|uniref:MBL fold metallo-hydrolase n=1 Tax=Bacterioplanes sanyensis TaxID=1249553 RepID=UPI001678A9A2|nr:MBL fold metallo-hydrolase [Bacterioplanes sanyensis]GGY41063.1 hypothetical protein GCM10011297_12590 [Bacterioplanes sanyensis]
MKFLTHALILTIAVLLSACSSQLKRSPSTPETATSATNPEALTIQYLGVGGHLISYQGSQLLTAPSFTNPHLLRTGPWMPLSADIEKIDRYMPATDNVQMLLVGHAHYDHLLDVPHIAQQHTPDAVIYGSATTRNTLLPALPASRLVAMNEHMGSSTQPGRWFYSADRRIRIMGLESGHAPHLMGLKFMSGSHEQPLKSLPWHAFGWKEGQTLAFLIDFLDSDEQPVHRIYYQDAASQAPAGLVPPLEDGKNIDVAILCPASFSQVEQYPESVVANTQARHYILGHWEDFFANDLEGKQRFVRLTDEDEFIERLEAALPANSDWVLPGLFSTHRFEPET